MQSFDPKAPRPYAVEYVANPSQDELRRLALDHTPAVLRTAHGNLDKISRNKSRVAQYTYVISDDPDAGRKLSAKTIDSAAAADLIRRQREYIEDRGRLIQIDGYLGLGERAAKVQWLYTLEGANIAGMQQVLAFPVDAVEGAGAPPRAPEFRVIYTPGLFAEGMPGRQALLVDLERYVTYIIGPDYFGESKKSALRMLCDRVYRQGGLVLHAGAKAIHTDGKAVAMAIMGLSGTGKTTTTFSKQGDLAQPIQDDMISLWPGGEVTITENGCFAKTAGLSPETEPVIYHGTLDPSAWVENVYVDADGRYDFSKGVLAPDEVRRLREVLVLTGASEANVDAYVRGDVKLEDVLDAHGVPKDGWDFVAWTQNGRSIIPMAAIQDAADLRNVPPVKFMGVLNRDEGPDAATPGIVRFTSPEQAAGYFMLGETTKTSAAGKERGKTRSPFTQPFFPLAHGLQARRFGELAATMPDVSMWMMNTGYVGGDARDVERGKALKVKIRHSSAMLEGLMSDRVVWMRDPDFGYEVVDARAPENAWLLERVPREVLQPRAFYEKEGRLAEYRAWVDKMKAERRAFLEKYDVDPAIVAAVVGT
ncbi:phosphoenolpyruvate carboxykinase (ATP) [Myxococcota bacterium]|nr:phosphoenolpyruvate carboxykinase (ATP) [Myxococcota bacterium]